MKGKNKLKGWWKPTEGYVFYAKDLKMLMINAHNNKDIGDDFYDVSAQEGDLPLLSIGQMIEFLGDGWEQDMLEAIDGYWEDGAFLKYTNNELCDALWRSVKEVLDK